MHERLCALKGLLRAISRLEESIREDFGVTLTEALCLCSIEGGCASALPLADDVGLSSSRLSRVLSSLENKGFIARQRRVDDKRNWEINPTAAGLELLARMRDNGIDMPAELDKFGKLMAEGV